MRRYFECALRIKFGLLIAAMLVAGSAFTFVYLSKQTYSTSALVWVDRPIYFVAVVPSNGSQVASPADNQAAILSEYMGTSQFTVTIARRAGIPMPSNAAEGAAIDDLQRNVKVETLGPHLLSISYTNKRPTYCTAIVSQTMQLFVEQIIDNRITEGQAALELYQQQRDAAQQQMEKSRQALTDYLQANPDSGLTASAPNPIVQDLQQQFVVDRSRYNDVVARIDSITADPGATGLLSSDYFRLVDPPRDPEPTPLLSQGTWTNAGLAFTMGLLVAVALTLISTWLDPVLHTQYDVGRVLARGDENSASQVLVGGVPYVKALGRTTAAPPRVTGTSLELSPSRRG